METSRGLTRSAHCPERHHGTRGQSAEVYGESGVTGGGIGTCVRAGGICVLWGGGGRGDGAGPVSAGGVVQLAGHGCRRWQLLTVLHIGAGRDSRSDSVCSWQLTIVLC